MLADKALDAKKLIALNGVQLGIQAEYTPLVGSTKRSISEGKHLLGFLFSSIKQSTYIF